MLNAMFDCIKGTFNFNFNIVGVPYLGSIPLDPRLAQCSDQGLNIYSEHPDSLVVQSYTNIVQQISTVICDNKENTAMDVQWGVVG